ncbi:MAG TPA: YafY family transcriptional regulator [Candidatus Coproplasma stercoravium]|nr:YafY family transcriptional regulator [Candidatus Coproplasma stercoravium]
MKYQIMIKILMLLLSRRKVCAREIAERYEISVRSVYRYIEELCVAGIPIDVARGRYGGLTIADTYRLPVGYFTKDEYTAAVNALTAMSSQVSDEAVLTALEKLQRQIKSERADTSVSGGIIVDGGTWGDTKKFSDKMAVCERAVNESLCLDIDYISRSGEHSRRIIDPHVLIFKQNVWYVYAFCHTKQSFRTFKIGRIKSARFTGKTFEKREISREEIPLNFGYRSEELIELVLEIDKEKLPDAEEWIGIDNIEPRGKKFVAEVSVPDDDGLVSKILGFGGGVKVVSPAAMRNKVIAAANNIIATV